MIICICTNISDSQIKQELNRGLTLDEVCDELDIGVKCGKCLSYLHSHQRREDTDDNK